MKAVTKIMIISLFLFAIVGDFIIGVFGVGSIRLISLISFVLFFGLYLIMKQDKALNKLIIAIFSLVIVFIVLRGELIKGMTAIYCIPLGYVIAKEWKYCSPYLDVIFCIQFVLLLYETLTGSYIYNEIISGIINAQSNNFDADLQMERVMETGFRTKGLFAGTLTASSFVVYYSYLNKDNGLKLCLSLLMTLLIKGRFAILSVFLLFAYTYFNSLKEKYNKTFLVSVFILAGLLLYLVFVGLTSGSDGFIYHLLHVFDINGVGNYGRIWAYTQAYNTFMYDYGLTQKLLGDTYELFDEYGRTGVSSESEFLGQLLEIGIIGTSIYVFAFYKLFRCKQKTGVSVKFVALMMLLGYLEYRHCSGNLRAMMFWAIFFLYTKYYDEYERLNQKNIFLNRPRRTRESISLIVS